MKFSYAWLQTYFNDKLPTPEVLEETLGLHAFEPEGIEKAGEDTVLDFDVLPNRAHDCLCHQGLAKEIKTLFQLPMQASRYQQPPAATPKSDLPLSVSIADTARCARYSGLVIENITVGPSPDWLRKRLESIGQRSINNVVDATNFVMFDLGQPLHAFDYDKISDATITVRGANENESITLLGGEEKELPTDTLVIADTGGPLAVAGIKGGQKAEVDSATTNIIIEAANFEPVSTRKSSRAIKIQTDSSKRFENEITPEWTKPAIEACANLIFEIAGTPETKIGELVDDYPGTAKQKEINLDVAKVNRMLGLNLSQQEIAKIFNRLGFNVTNESGVFSVQIPAERIDLSIPEDLVEEIGRVYGYENIPTTLPTNPAAIVHPETFYTHQIRNWLTNQGWHEVMTYTFSSRGAVEMTNALASDKSHLRNSLRDGFAESLEKNIRNSELFGSESIKQFEIGQVFPGGIQETHLVLGFASNNKKEKMDLNQTLSELGQHTGLALTGAAKEGILEINLTPLISTTTETTYEKSQITTSEDVRSFYEISIYPFITRDIAVWLPADTDPAALEQIITANGGELLARSPRLFDQFSKDGRTSYAYRLVFQAHDRTLTDEEINKIMQKNNRDLEGNGWEIR